MEKRQAFACLCTEVFDLANKESLFSRARNSLHIFVRFSLTCDSGVTRGHGLTSASRAGPEICGDSAAGFNSSPVLLVQFSERAVTTRKCHCVPSLPLLGQIGYTLKMNL